MSLLVANYGGSSSEYESEEEEDAAAPKSAQKSAAPESNASSGVNLLTCTNSDDDDSDDSGKLSLLPRSVSQQRQKKTKPHKAVKAEDSLSKLPLPSFMMQAPSSFSSPSETIITGTSGGGSESTPALNASSVFTNQFAKAEQQKLSVLEQHVKLSSTEKTEAEMGKKICWMFRKGRCRFGHKCKFAHDNDVLPQKQSTHDGHDGEQTNQDGTAEGYQIESNQQMQASGQHHQQASGQHHHQQQHHRQHFQQQQGHYQNELHQRGDNEDEEAFQMRKRKKPGLAQGLVPPKRSMAAYGRQAAQERPWTNK